MATVVGKTSVRIDELLSDTIVKVEIVEGNLLTTDHAGFVSNVGPVGGAGGDVTHSRQFTFNVASQLWVCDHNLNQKVVHVTVRDINDDELIGDVDYVTDNQCTISWHHPTAGVVTITR